MPSISLNIGLKALLTSQSALDTVGHNVSNANTPGYSRQSLQVSASPAMILRGITLGNGVDANFVLRTADDLITKRLVAQTSSIQQLETRIDGMGQVEALLGEPGDRGLNALMQGFFSSLSALAADPEDAVLRTGLVQSTQSMTSRFQELSGNLATMRADSARQVETQIGQVNALADEIAKLNREIGGFEGGGGRANDLRDQRDEALSQLGALTKIRYEEHQNGTVTVVASGAVIVGQSRAYEVQASVRNDGSVEVGVEGHPGPVRLDGGSIGGLLRVSQEYLPSLSARLDSLAHELVLQVNRAHSTGVPATGSFRALTGANAIQDEDGDGDLEDELLSSSGLPFDVRSGSLHLNVTDATTGAVTTTRIDVDPATTSVRDLLDAIESAGHVSATLDGSGRVQITADQGYRFDFSRRVNPRPDANGTFGGEAASLGAATDGPYALADGDTLQINGPGGAFTLTLDGADFADVSRASADELANAINSDPATASNGMRAVVAGGRVFLQSLQAGASTSFTVQGGTALAALGWSAGQVATGQAHSVDVAIGGTYTGNANEQYTFVPSGDGTIGTTPNLTVGVFDSGGRQVATLAVGDGYEPGTDLELPNGLHVSFGLGDLSATDHDRFTVDALADSDTSDVLVALGVNSFLTGSSASDVALRKDIELDPNAISASTSGADGDNAVLNEMVAIQRASSEALGDKNVGEYYGDLVGGIGFDVDTAQNARDVEQFLHDSLTERRQQVAGVNVDEELVNMIQYQQSYGAAAQFIQTVNRTLEDLLSIV